jgi:hypothetical protein
MCGYVHKPAEARLGYGMQEVEMVEALIHHLKVVANAGRLKPAPLRPGLNKHCPDGESNVISRPLASIAEIGNQTA